MISCQLLGGLGNQLFQIFTTIAYATKMRQPFAFLDKHQLNNGLNGSTIRYTYWNTFLSFLKPFLKNADEMPSMLCIKEPGFTHSEIPENFNLNYGSMLVGYFQSPLYFDMYKDTILKLMRFNIKQQIVRAMCAIDYENTISMHFRLGDYKKLHGFYPILPVEYYKNALSHIVEELPNHLLHNLQVLYFCEEEDSDIINVIKTIEQLQQLFPTIVFERASNEMHDWEQMIVMSLCQYNIIANSTFSWWGAYLNTNVCKIVCYPDIWFGPKISHDTTTLFPEDWISISLD
jgi:hypothetical protein